MKRTLFALASSLALLTLPAGAGIVITTNVTDLASSQTSQLIINGTNGVAAAFTTAGGDTSLYSIQAVLNPVTQAGGLPAPRNITGYNAYLYSDNAGAPGSLLTAIGTTVNAASTDSLVTFGNNVNYFLQPDTTYFVILKVSNPTYTGLWYDTSSPVVTSPSGWTIDSGHELTGSSPTTTLAGDTMLFSVQTTPEPGTLALAGLGAAALWRLRRKA